MSRDELASAAAQRAAVYAGRLAVQVSAEPQPTYFKREAVEDALAEAQGQAWGARLADSHAALREAEDVVAGLRVERDQVIRGAVGAGWSMYRVAQMLGLSQQAVRKIVNWQ